MMSHAGPTKPTTFQQFWNGDIQILHQILEHHSLILSKQDEPLLDELAKTDPVVAAWRRKFPEIIDPGCIEPHQYYTILLRNANIPITICVMYSVLLCYLGCGFPNVHCTFTNFEYWQPYLFIEDFRPGEHTSEFAFRVAKRMQHSTTALNLAFYGLIYGERMDALPMDTIIYPNLELSKAYAIVQSLERAERPIAAFHLIQETDEIIFRYLDRPFIVPLLRDMKSEGLRELTPGRGVQMKMPAKLFIALAQQINWNERHRLVVIVRFIGGAIEYAPELEWIHPMIAAIANPSAPFNLIAKHVMPRSDSAHILNMMRPEVLMSDLCPPQFIRAWSPPDRHYVQHLILATNSGYFRRQHLSRFFMIATRLDMRTINRLISMLPCRSNNANLTYDEYLNLFKWVLFL